MQNMIKRIVDMDKRARELTEQAKLRRAGSVEAAEKKKEEVRQNYINLARKRIEVIERSEMRDAQEDWEKIEARHAEIADRLDRTYAEKKDEWVDELVRRVTKGDGLL
ncbi:MAG: hypothetical protein IJP10_03560 [Clostridia bacterium]|nr:hypothetical protein [Oscillospiraceae bacterium]MBQ6797071.1 hypothetical protein [Clostridia bacterium]